MDWKQFFASIISSLSWPIAAVLVVGLLRTSLMGLIPKIRSFKYGDLHIDLGKELEAVKAEITEQNAEGEPPTAPPPPPTPTTIELASYSPRSAMLMAWRDVERAIDTVFKKHGLQISNTNHSVSLRMRVLREQNLIDEQTMSTFKKLYSLRNEAVHVEPLEIVYEDAISMAELCQWLIKKLEDAN